MKSFQSKMHIFKRLGFVLMVVTLITGCRDREAVTEDEDGRMVVGEVEVESQEERVVAPGDRELTIEGYNGLVELTGANVASATLQFTRRARGRNEAAARERLRNISIDEFGDGSTYRISVEAERPNVTSVDVRGEVPSNVPLRVLLTNGSVTISGLNAPVIVENQNGHVRIERSTSGIDISTRNGTLEASIATLPADAVIRLSTINGDVILELPQAADASIRASTQAGPIRAQGLEFAQRRLDPGAAGNRFSGQLGRGLASIELETQNGAVIMRATQPTPGAPEIEMPEMTGPLPQEGEI
jgi:hypothetical protein